MRRHGRALIVSVLCCVAVLLLVVAQRSTEPERSPREIPPPEESQRSSRKRVLSPDERDEALARAQVWRRPQVPVSKAYLGQDRSAPRELDCTFKLNPPSGTTPKFDCVTGNGEEIRIKYGVGGELPGEAATTRLLTALGFGADSITLIERLRCFGCPKEPFTVMKLVATTGTDSLYEHVINEESYEVFRWVALERRFPALAIDVTDGTEGWAFFELDKVDSAKGCRATRACRCTPFACGLSRALGQQVGESAPGLSVGGLAGRHRLPDSPFCCFRMLVPPLDPGRWISRTGNARPSGKIARRARSPCVTCPTTVPPSATARVSEEGRRFLSGLLEQLTDVQITDLFSGARFDKGAGHLPPVRAVDEWVRVFKARRAAIAEGPACPPL